MHLNICSIHAMIMIMNRYDKKSDDDMYYEIEYDSGPFPGVGRYISKPQMTPPHPERDEIRETFGQMRSIEREFRERSWIPYARSKFYDKIVRQENSKIFYKQGMFMQDFEDDYQDQVPFSSYFPYYQMMGYEQLRTYFTWRTQVRTGCVRETSLSYAYLYIYELLSNIGVKDPQEGLDQLLFFWNEFRDYDASIDKYVIKWLKDYHIYYDLEQAFPEFAAQNGLAKYYPELHNRPEMPGNGHPAQETNQSAGALPAPYNFELLCGTSKYDIRKSVFYATDHKQLIEDCISGTIGRLSEYFQEKGLVFDDFLFQPEKNMTTWTPFQGALFYPWLQQPDRRVVFSAKEIYLCTRNKWTYQTSLTNESGRRLLGYIFKQAESVLRELVHYRYRLTASIQVLSPAAITRLHAAGISLETAVTEAVQEFYRETTRTVVRVNPAALDRIRQDALATQEKLTVPEEPDPFLLVPPPALDSLHGGPENNPPILGHLRGAAENDSWTVLRHTLSETELAALACLLTAKGDIRKFADQHGVMLEVLIDGLNEKAMDVIGDSLVDEEFTIYEDYTNNVKEMVE